LSYRQVVSKYVLEKNHARPGLRAIRGIKNTRLPFFITKLGTKEVSFFSWVVHQQLLFQILLMAICIATNRKFTNVNSALGSVLLFTHYIFFQQAYFPFKYLVMVDDVIKTKIFEY